MSEQKQMSEESFHKLVSSISEVATDTEQLRGSEARPKANTPFIDTIGESPYKRIMDRAAVEGAEISHDSTVYADMRDGNTKVGNIHTVIHSKVKTTAGDYNTRIASGGVAHQFDEEFVPRTMVTRVEGSEKVTRQIKNPRAAELITRLAVKRAKQAEDRDRKAA